MCRQKTFFYKIANALFEPTVFVRMRINYINVFWPRNSGGIFGELFFNWTKIGLIGTWNIFSFEPKKRKLIPYLNNIFNFKERALKEIYGIPKTDLLFKNP